MTESCREELINEEKAAVRTILRATDTHRGPTRSHGSELSGWAHKSWTHLGLVNSVNGGKPFLRRQCKRISGLLGHTTLLTGRQEGSARNWLEEGVSRLATSHTL